MLDVQLLSQHQMSIYVVEIVRGRLGQSFATLGSGKLFVMDCETLIDGVATGAAVCFAI